MFGKKVLSFIGLLFLGSQFTSVSALTSCTFDLSAGCSCTCSETGYYAVFTSDTPSEYHVNVDTDSNDDGKLVYVSETNVCEVKGTSITGFFKSPDGTIISNDYTGKALVLSDVGDCTTGNAGKLVDTDTICIGMQSDTTTPVTLAFGATDNEVYLTGDKAEVFSNDNTKSAVVGFTETTIAIDKTYNDDDFCVDADTKIVTKRPQNYCSSDSDKDCDSYVNCIEGVCSVATISRRAGQCDMFTGTNCVENGDYYYIVKSSSRTLASDSDLVSSPGEGILFKCSVVGGVHQGCNAANNVAGYFKNNHAAHTDVPYIKCTLTTTSTNTCVALLDTPATESTCAGHSTSIITTDNKTYKDCNSQEDDASAVVINNVIPGACDKNGDLIKSGGYKLCVKDKDGNLSQISLGDASYFVDAGNLSVFNNKVVENHFVVVDIDAKNFILNRDASPLKYRYAVYETREIKAKGADASMCDADPKLDTNYGHEFEKTKQPESEDATPDYVHYYKDNNQA